MKRWADLSPDGLCRVTLGREWDPRLPRAAWLLTNPSRADHQLDDPTTGRVIHFSRKLGCGSAVLVNYRPWRTTYPADLYRAVRAGLITEAMMRANDEAILEAVRSSSEHVVAFGAGPPAMDRVELERALDLFCRSSRWPWCLGITDSGWPLHPLARGAHAIPNDRLPRLWERPA